MKLFSFGSRNKRRSSAKTSKADPVEDATVTSSSLHSQDHASKERQSSLKDREAALNIKAAANWMAAMNSYDESDPIGYADKITNCYESPNIKIILEDGEKYKPADCNALFLLTFESFPNFKMTHGQINTVIGNPNLISIDTVMATGTHTGKPYTIMPGALEAVEPSGKVVSNDEQRFILDMKHGKIRKVTVYAMGSFTGFVGFYARAGGNLEPLEALKNSKSKTEE